ncbi:OLC1v1025779C1 [Oldenlandia corymbosa var. corymbosa]|uniref:OLC1v1025779C1 n=1 Tax=Oldenlandia corymbosa var. corymbosa TaxID=529605 RepID=A0AAV1C5J2_OLDCO|nr:OLC1v1025779C1 [Oldenlandia corymbosa var. corymbosa]
MGMVSGESQAVPHRTDERSMWDALKKKINGLVRKVNASNVRDISEELLSQDLIWGRGLFCSAVLRYSPDSEPVLAALVAAINSRFPDVGYLLLKRIINQFKFALNQKEHAVQLIPLSKLLAQLVNQGVVRKLVAIEIVFLLLLDCTPSSFNIQIAAGFVEQCGSVVYASNPRGMDTVLERFQEVIDEGDLDADVVCLIEKLISRGRRRKLRGGHNHIVDVVPAELDIVEVDDQVTHEISVLNELDSEMFLDHIAVGGHFPDGSKHNERLTPMKEHHEEAEDYADDEDLKSPTGLLSAPKFQRLVKNFKSLSQLFAYKDDEMEDEDFSMDIGLPTDVKHVTHIGIDGSATSILSKGWDNLKAPDFHGPAPPVHFRPSPDFLATPARASPHVRGCSPLNSTPSLSGTPAEVPFDFPAPSIHLTPSPLGTPKQVFSAVQPTRSPFAKRLMQAQAPSPGRLIQSPHSVPSEVRQLNVKGA